MTATPALSPGLTARGVNTLLRMAALAILLTVLIVGSFAFGRSTVDASDNAPAVVRTSNPVSTPAPANCGHAAHTPPVC